MSFLRKTLINNHKIGVRTTYAIRYHRILSNHKTFPQKTCKASFNSLIPFKLADIGEGIAEVELMKWFVKEGDRVKSFDRICEVQSDKATVEITSRYDGKVVRVHHPEGAIVKVGSALIDIQAEDIIQTSPKLVNEDLPKISESLSSSSISSEPSSGHFQNSENSYSRNGTIGSEEKVLTTPAVRKLAKENQINLEFVKGSGPRGRILKEDILRHIYQGGSGSNNSNTSIKVTSIPTSSINSFQSNPKSGFKSTEKLIEQSVATTIMPTVATTAVIQPMAEDKRVPIRGIQRLMVKSMNAANQVKHLTLGEEIVCNKLMALRKTLKIHAMKQNIKLSYLPIMIKTTSLALSQYPILNATVNEDASEMIYHVNHNIGIAMDTPKGLIVPVIKQVQRKSIFEIAIELSLLQEAAMKGTITETQLSGGTFSLSNIGSIGGTYAVPVLVMPQVCIGAIGRMITLPRYVDEDGNVDPSIDIIESEKAQVLPTTVMNVSWSADHRVVDGATIARFSNTWKAYLESPDTILANLR